MLRNDSEEVQKPSSPSVTFEIQSDIILDKLNRRYIKFGMKVLCTFK